MHWSINVSVKILVVVVGSVFSELADARRRHDAVNPNNREGERSNQRGGGPSAPRRCSRKTARLIMLSRRHSELRVVPGAVAACHLPQHSRYLSRDCTILFDEEPRSVWKLLRTETIAIAGNIKQSRLVRSCATFSSVPVFCGSHSFRAGLVATINNGLSISPVIEQQHTRVLVIPFQRGGVTPP